MDVNQGDLYWVALASPDVVEAGIAHPHVVIRTTCSTTAASQTVVDVRPLRQPQTRHPARQHFLDPGEADLPRQSIVQVSQVSTVNKADLGSPIGSRIGALSRERVQQILAGMRLLQRMADQ